MKLKSIALFVGACATLACLVPGCAWFGGNQNRYASSLVDYLYPKQKKVFEEPSIPHLELPLRVGIAFVPASIDRSWGGSALSEKDKMDLMERVASQFRSLKFVKDIELIPSSYLSKGGGFTNLDQLRTMYGIDVIALVACDQVQHTDEGLLSLTYWTLIGAYIFKGEKNSTSTMVDAAVYDIRSRKMLFRAPGTSYVKGSATPVNLSEQLRNDSAKGYREAANDLVKNLKIQLKLFKQKIKEMPESYQVNYRQGYSGGGAIGGAFALILLGLGGYAQWRKREE